MGSSLVWPTDLVYCGNLAVFQALNSGKLRDPFLVAGLRELWFFAACSELELRAVHLSSSAKRAADLLSHWHLDSSYAAQFQVLPNFSNLKEVTASVEFFLVSDFA